MNRAVAVRPSLGFFDAEHRNAGLTDWHLRTGLCVGRRSTDAAHCRPFGSPADRSRAGFHQVTGIPVVVASWDVFLRSATECGEAVGSVGPEPEA